ncbi:hypothetical protein RND71_012122 [Anisodus tanguticus]|uniref:Uncharacterized protein n=1 Tax=Anisodus tanguticus TaxID=243964 RepID=A0AAE1SEK4_9SOLA|nr:hypothetical protein RND71_012122 [Anisodus tanguticus]
MVNASACCTVEQEVKEEKALNVNNIAEISAELQREKQKNAKLIERISVLESQIQEKHKDFNFSNGNGNASCQSIGERHFRKLKRQKVAQCIDTNEDRTRKMDSEVKDHTEIFLMRDVHTEHCLVNWVSMDDTRFLNCERSKDSYSDEENDPDDSEDEDDQESDDNGTYTDIVDRENVKTLQIEKETGEASDPPFLESCDHHADPAEKSSSTDMDVCKNSRGLGNCNNEEINMLEDYEELSKARLIDHGIRRQGSASSHKKSLKMAFCPKENEYVLYDNPGVRRKIFFPNRQNRALCPVRILEEEKTMRPSDAICPSCLFLCINYGGRTRNLPQNETDEDAEREELFLSHSEADDIVRSAIHGHFLQNLCPNSEQETKAWTKTRSKSEAISKIKTSEKATTIHSEPSFSAPFGLMGYASSPSPMTQAPVDMTKPVMANTASNTSPMTHAPIDMTKPVMANTTSNIHYHNQCSYPVFPMYPPNSFVPFVYWPQPNVYAPFPHHSSYRYIAPGSCISVQPYSYYSHMCHNPLIPESLGTNEKQNGGSDEAKRESNSSSSSTDSREK